MMVGPMGEEEAAGAVVKEGETLFRGVPGGETEKAILGKLGIAKPRGTALDAESLAKHVRGEDVNAGVTSWTTDRGVANALLAVKDSASRAVPRGLAIPFS